MKVFKIGRKVVGSLDGDIFSKEVLKSKHLFRVLDAWGCDSSIIHKLRDGTKIRIHDLEEDVTYFTTKEVFMEYGEYYHFKQPKEDYRAQLFLRRDKFKVEEPVKLEGDELERANYMKAMGL